ncbi:response regulator transcription factor [Pseudomonas sp. EA_65y_Pfl1_P120]|uniref:response regulator transcription factor n=1 Tax=Pseudomonas sp. EA_65y_Pfl1_P120 TaxID=3088693 RepID=UPI0030D86461
MSATPLRVLLVDDHVLFRQGLAALLARETDIEVVGHAANGLEALTKINLLHPHMVILDLEMPLLNGLDTLRRARSDYPTLRVLCLSAYAQLQKVSMALKAGALGYLLKDCAVDEVIKALRTIASGRVYISPELATALVVNQHLLQHDYLPGATLSPRERQILQLLVVGHTTRKIAESLHISCKTVSTHREHIMAKLNVNGIAQLTRYALREGLL